MDTMLRSLVTEWLQEAERCRRNGAEDSTVRLYEDHALALERVVEAHAPGAGGDDYEAELVAENIAHRVLKRRLARCCESLTSSDDTH